MAFSSRSSVTVTCDICVKDIGRKRYQCAKCLELNICENCKEAEKRPDNCNSEHEMFLIISEGKALFKKVCTKNCKSELEFLRTFLKNFENLTDFNSFLTL